MSAEKPAISMMAIQKNIQEALAKPEAKQSCLLFEYKLLLLYSANFGIYVMPEMNKVDVWHGVVFVRFGIYKDARYKFKMVFDQFPAHPPEVYFMSQVYHPNVNFQNGQLDIGQQLQKQWNYGSQHLIFNIVEYIRLIFLDVKYYSNDKSYNKGAGELFNTSPDEFFSHVRESVQISKNQVFNNYSQTSLKFTPCTSKHQKVKDILKQICDDQNLNFEEKKKKFMASVKNVNA